MLTSCTGAEVLTTVKSTLSPNNQRSQHSISNLLEEETIRQLTFRPIARNGHGTHSRCGPSDSAGECHLRRSPSGTRAAKANTHRQSLSHIAIFSLGTFPAGQSEGTASYQPGHSHVGKSTGGKCNLSNMS